MKLTKQEFDSALKYNKIIDHADKIKQDYINSIDNIHYLKQCNYKLSYFIYLNRTNYNKLSFIKDIILFYIVCICLQIIIYNTCKYCIFILPEFIFLSYLFTKKQYLFYKNCKYAKHVLKDFGFIDSSVKNRLLN